MMENYWPTAGKKPNATRHDLEHSKWYASVHKVVLSKTMKDGAVPNTEIIRNNLSDRINEIKQSPPHQAEIMRSSFLAVPQQHIHFSKII
jgi:hypothetical protein